MPRQLPWLTGSGAGKVKRKPAPKPVEEDDEEFFAGTLLGSSRERNKSASRLPSSDIGLAARPSVHPLGERPKSTEGNGRQLSSSPPPIADLALPKTEYMRKGVAKSDLRDDEWMMVEDEFLQTARLFNRHLLLAEYDRLKKDIEVKKEMDRPVVPNVQPSVERLMKLRADRQESKQRKALKEVILEYEDNEDLSSERGQQEKVTASASLPPLSRSGSVAPERTTVRSSFLDIASSELKKTKTRRLIDQSTDDDLDAPRAYAHRKPTTTSLANAFAKPALPSRAQTSTIAPSTRPTRKNPFDLLDEEFPPPKRPISPTKSSQSSISTSWQSQRSQSATSAMKTSQPSGTSFKTTSISQTRETPSLPHDGIHKPKQLSPSKQQADRFAKRKAEREKKEEQEQSRRKSVKLDDIPTFLF